jgi:hypothetical protein
MPSKTIIGAGEAPNSSVAARAKLPEFLAVDFFSGAGGTTRGLLDAGGYVIAGVDKDCLDRGSCRFCSSRTRRSTVAASNVDSRVHARSNRARTPRSCALEVRNLGYLEDRSDAGGNEDRDDAQLFGPISPVPCSCSAQRPCFAIVVRVLDDRSRQFN